jgi:hypothetical protein
MTTPADELRTAAEKLRSLTVDATADIAANPYWGSVGFPPHEYPNLYARGVDNGFGGPAGEFAAAMHPGVGLALADWLDCEARTWDNPADGEPVTERDEHALAVARKINGTAS